MQVKGLIKQLQNLDQEKEITVVAPNGLLMPPQVKLELKDKSDHLNLSHENTNQYVIAWE